MKMAKIKPRENGSRRNQFLAAGLMNLTQFSYGSFLGLTSAVALTIRPPQTLGPPADDDTFTWFTASFYLGCLVATPVYGYLADAFGRKIAAIAVSLPSIASWIIPLWFTSRGAFMAVRVLAGISASGSMLVTPIYVAEISDNSHRGVLGALMILFQMTGMLAGFAASGLLNYSLTIALFLIPSTIHFFSFFIMPETPVYLISQDKNEKAAQSLAWLRSLKTDDISIQQDIYQMSYKSSSFENFPNVTLRNIFNEPADRRALRLVSVLLIVHIWSGGIFMVDHASRLFRATIETTWAATEFGSAIILGIIAVSGGLFAMILVDRLGRRTLLILSYACGSVCLVILAIWFFILENNIAAPDWVPGLTFAGMSLGLFSNVVGPASIPLVLLSEVFDFQVRSTLTVLALNVMWLCAILHLTSLTPLVGRFGIHSVVWFYAAASLIGLFYTLFFAPETKKRPIDDIVREFAEVRMKKLKLPA